MPRLPSDVWKHFSHARVDGKDIYLCKYCSQQYVKNATKMQRHLEKCTKFPQTLKKTKHLQHLLSPAATSLTTHGPSTSSASASAAGPSTADPEESISAPASQKCYFDFIDVKTAQMVDESLARAIYASGSPLNLTTNVYWQRCFKLLRPAYNLPTRHALDTTLLEAEYVRVQDKVNDTIQNADFVSVISDGWSNIRGEGIINYIVTTPQPVFYRSTDTKDQRHTAIYIADELKKVITEIGAAKVYAIVTDNAANMKAAWVQVKETFPHITPIGCAAHGLNLLLGDIMAMNTMQALYKKAKKVVKYVKSHQVVSSTFSAKQAQRKKKTALQLPSKTRWGGTVIMYDSLVHGKESLQEIAIMESLEVDSDIRTVLLDNDIFWVRIVNSLKLLEPISSAIEKIESDTSLLSDVTRHFAEIKEKVTAALPQSCLTKAEETSVVGLIGKREEFCLQPIHAAAYMLDPKCQSETMKEEQINSAYNIISQLAHHLHLDQGKVMASLAKFRAKDGLWRGEAVWSSAQYIPAATWWKGLCSSEALASIASVILQIPPTSAASERNWSLFGTTHTKKRNRLTNERVEKLVAIRSNLKLFEPTSDSSTQVNPGNADDDSDIVISSSDSEMQ